MRSCMLLTIAACSAAYPLSAQDTEAVKIDDDALLQQMPGSPGSMAADGGSTWLARRHSSCNGPGSSSSIRPTHARWSKISSSSSSRARSL